MEVPVILKLTHMHLQIVERRAKIAKIRKCQAEYPLWSDDDAAFNDVRYTNANHPGKCEVLYYAYGARGGADTNAVANGAGGRART